MDELAPRGAFALTSPISADLLARLAARRKILAIFCDGWALVFADDGGEIVFKAYRRDAAHYVEVFGRDDYAVPGKSGLTGWDVDWERGVGFAWAFGRTERHEVRLRWRTDLVRVQPDATGTWAFVRETEIDAPDGCPVIVD